MAIEHDGQTTKQAQVDGRLLKPLAPLHHLTNRDAAKPSAPQVAWGTDRPWTPSWDSSRTPVSSFDANWSERFHIWELDWTENRLAIYLDGQLLNDRPLANTINGAAECAGQNPFQQHHYLLLNLALGSNGGSVENLPFPTRYIVDYVRVYR